MENFFSVVIAAYNASDIIGPTLDSVRAQKYKNYEVILVDDGSPLCMRGTIEQYQQEHPDFPLRYVWQENTGPAGARKRCVEEARYEYVAFLDHDDIWYENKLSVMNQWINRVSSDIYCHDENEVQEDGKIHVTRYRDLGEDPLTDLILNGNSLSTSAVVVKRSVFLKCDPYKDRKRAGEDYECWIRLAKFGAKFCHVNEVLGEYRRLPKSLTMVNADYTKMTNEAIIGFYDYLDREKFSDIQIEKIKKRRKAFNEYLLGRFYHAKKEFRTAKKYYISSIMMGNYNWKCIAAFCIACIRKKV